jgi:hypothetical protein
LTWTGIGTTILPLLPLLPFEPPEDEEPPDPDDLGTVFIPVPKFSILFTKMPILWFSNY